MKRAAFVVDLCVWFECFTAVYKRSFDVHGLYEFSQELQSHKATMRQQTTQQTRSMYTIYRVFISFNRFGPSIATNPISFLFTIHFQLFCGWHSMTKRWTFDEYHYCVCIVLSMVFDNNKIISGTASRPIFNILPLKRYDEFLQMCTMDSVYTVQFTLYSLHRSLA